MGKYFCLYEITFCDEETNSDVVERGIIYADSYERASALVERAYKKKHKKINEITIYLLDEGFMTIEQTTFEDILEKYKCDHTEDKEPEPTTPPETNV